MSTNNTAKQIELLDTVRKKRAALEARLRKESFSSIADRMGVTITTVRNWVDEMTVTMLPAEESAELRAQEVAGIDILEARAHEMIDMLARQAARKELNQENIQYETEQIARWQEHIVRLKERRSKYLGLDTPPIVKHNVTVRTEFDAEVESLVSDLLGGGNVMSHPEIVDVGTDDGV